MATLYFDEVEDAANEFPVKVDDVEVISLGSWDLDDGVRLLVGAVVRLQYRPKLTNEGAVLVPEEPRRLAEAAIEHAANLIAVAQGTRRRISSPSPCVALIADGEDGKRWLEQATFFDVPHGGAAHPDARSNIDLTDEILSGLNDRLDGVALLAEALAHGHATGQFHELMRVFERAFASPPKVLAGPLAELLDPRFGYTEDEVRNWTETLRGPATHADVRPGFVLEGDTRRVSARMKQAAFDVLLNKKNWRSPDAERRHLWSAPTGTSSTSNDIFSTTGAAPKMSYTMTDPFGAYPFDPAVGIATMPDGWWSKFRPEAPDGEATSS